MNIESLNKFLHRREETEEHWISLSDVMAGLMMVFLLIAIVYMLKIQAIAKDLKLIEVDLHNELEKEFEDDFENWNAVLDVLTVRFREPRVLFSVGKDELKFKFKRILNEFIPRYIKIINKKKYKEKISEIRIEGHTSSDFSNLSPEEAYIENMRLSQSRAKSTLVYILTHLPEIETHKDWFKKLVAAVGLSSSRLIKTPDGDENIKQSRRVEFRILLNTDEVLSKISSLSK